MDVLYLCRSGALVEIVHILGANSNVCIFLPFSQCVVSDVGLDVSDKGVAP